MIDLLSIANTISTLFLFFRDMLLRRKRKEGKEGRKEVGESKIKGHTLPSVTYLHNQSQCCMDGKVR